MEDVDALRLVPDVHFADSPSRRRAYRRDSTARSNVASRPAFLDPASTVGVLVRIRPTSRGDLDFTSITYSSLPRLNVLFLPPTRNSSLMMFALASKENVNPESFLAMCWLFHAPSKVPATRGSPGLVLVSAANSLRSAGLSESNTEMSWPFGAL